MKKNAAYLIWKKQQGEKITALTGYDYPTARFEDQAGVDVIVVGDSVGTNMLGYTSETEVTLADITHHLKAVKRGVTESYILADLPYHTYETPDQALVHAQMLISCGADGVKLEGLHEEVIMVLIQAGIEVCGHLGLLPQVHQKKSVQGKTFEQARLLIENAAKLERLGVFAIVLELIPEELGRLISDRVQVPTIGIGSGRFTDGQVLIVQDILGITPRKLRLAKQYQDFQALTVQTIEQYCQEVTQGIFPSEENVRHMVAEELDQLTAWLNQQA